MDKDQDKGKLPEEKEIDPKKEGGSTNLGHDRTGGHTETGPLPNKPAENAEREGPEEESDEKSS